MNNGNWIKIHRQIMKWGWYDDPATKAVFIHLLLNATWQESEYHGVKLQPGDVIFGRKKYAKELGLSEQNVRTAIKHLLESSEISTIQTTNRFTAFRIEKWSIYQGDEVEDNQQANQQLTNNQPTTNHIQEGKKERIYIYNNIYSRAEHDEIISYLNQRIGSHYKANTKKTVSLINARLKEGFTVDDFKTVIDVKAAQWENDPKMAEYLRPQTLFSGNFEAYLNQKPIETEDKPDIFEKLVKKIRAGYSHLRLTKTEADTIPFESYVDIKERQNELTDEQIISELKGAANVFI